MYHLFNPENKFWNFIAKITDVACMSILWALVSLPVFTIGATTTAFYDFALHQVNDREGKILKSFFSSFKAHFGRATLLWLIELAGIAFLALDLWAAWPASPCWASAAASRSSSSPASCMSIRCWQRSTSS